MTFERPRTIKLYLHPPESASIVTVWPDFKVVDKPVLSDPAALSTGCGLRLLFGPEAAMPDWHDTRFKIRDDGIPVHRVEGAFEDIQVELEAFCAWGVQPATHLRLTLRNSSLAGRDAVLGAMPRTGRSSMLFGLAPDMYASYQPRLEHWDLIANTWALDGDGAHLYDGAYRIAFGSPAPLVARWVDRNPANPAAKSYLELLVHLEGRASCEVYLALASEALPEGRLHPGPVEYDTQLQAATAQWQAELAKVTSRPQLPDIELEALFNSLICQSLQMLATSDDGRVRPRQGGINDHVWPTEAIEYLMAFDRMGLHDAAEQGYRYLFHTQVQDGADRGRVVGLMKWTNDTGAALYGLAYHLMQRGDRACFDRWRGPAVTAWEWIERQRAQTKQDPGSLGYGLFPAGIGHDWGTRAQFWCFTDGFLYMGADALAAAFEQFDDPLAAAMRAAAADYRSCLDRVLQKLAEPQRGKPEAFIPNALGAPDSYPPPAVYQADGPALLMRAGLIDPRSELFEQVERYFANRGWMRRGLTHLMTESLFTHSPFESDPWAGHTWYISFTDMIWFNAWLARGEREKAAETLWAQLRYGMSAEHYMQERYADNDPAFCPWQPNASANGRLIMMLFDYFG